MGWNRFCIISVTYFIFGYTQIKQTQMLFYRVANHETQQGLWYDYKGNFTGLIHDKFNFCTNNKLPMPYDPNIVGWLSAAETLDELFNWFTPNDIKELEKHGYRIAIYEAYEYKRYNNHWVIKQNNSRLVICVSLIKHNVEALAKAGN